MTILAEPLLNNADTERLTASVLNAQVSQADNGTSLELLSFRLGQEEYGINILCVQEIRSYEVPMRIANSSPFLKGVINLRGEIVPVVDLRLVLGCASVEYDHHTVVIVLNIQGRVIGAVVDSVSDVLALQHDEIKPVPEMNATSVNAAFMSGIASVDGKMLILMDIEALMSSALLG